MLGVVAADLSMEYAAQPRCFLGGARLKRVVPHAGRQRGQGTDSYVPTTPGKALSPKEEFIAVGLTGLYEWIKRALCLCEKIGKLLPLCRRIRDSSVASFVDTLHPENIYCTKQGLVSL